MRAANILDLLSDRSAGDAHVQLYVRKPRLCPSPKHQDKVAISPDCTSIAEFEEHVAGLKADLDLAVKKAKLVFEGIEKTRDAAS